MYYFIFKRIKKIIPKISDTEIIALKSGGVSIDREIFKGKMDYKKLLKPITKVISKNINMDKKIDELLQKFGSGSIYPNKNILEPI
jgi:hypothetical protein